MSFPDSGGLVKNLYDRIVTAQNLLPSDPNQITRPQLLQFTREILSIFRIRLWRGMGQHFLVSPEILRYLLLKANLKPDDTILEIGGGIGTLSLFLARKVKKLVIIEQDPRLVEILSTMLREFSNVLILPGDACKVDWPPFDKLVSNLPYQISSPVTLRLIRTEFSMALISFQLEFAQRLLASAGDHEYSRISVQSTLFLETELLIKEGNEAFFPSPNVTSAIVKITPRNRSFELNLDLFEQFLMILFSRKNKKVVNNLIPYFKRYDKQTSNLVKKLLHFLKLQEKRPSHLSPQKILHLFKNIHVSFQAHGFSFTEALLQK